jgi:hypothetical protein
MRLESTKVMEAYKREPPFFALRRNRIHYIGDFPSEHRRDDVF